MKKEKKTKQKQKITIYDWGGVQIQTGSMHAVQVMGVPIKITGRERSGEKKEKGRGQCFSEGEGGGRKKRTRTYVRLI